MIPPYVVLHKEVGQTPLQTIEAWKRRNPAYASLPTSYAGRLDPMASGKLLVLIGEECKRQERYRGLDKEYEIEVLLDLSTDTGDVLGMPAYAGALTKPRVQDISRALRDATGTTQVPYPAFSSKTVHGKPLFQYALEGMLDTIVIPTHAETIYRIDYLDMRSISKAPLQKEIDDILSLAPRTHEPSKELGADFRQDAIREAWLDVFSSISDREFTVFTLRVTCASGSYMRTLSQRIGDTLGTTALTLSIERTVIGSYKRLPGFGFWVRKIT